MNCKWEKTTIGNVAKVVGGGTPSSKVGEYYGGNISWITPKDLSAYTSKRISVGKRSITELGLSKSSAKLLPKDAVLLTSRAPIGYVAIAAQELATNQGFKSLILKDGYDPDFFYYLLKMLVPELEAIATGSTFKEISGSSLKQVEILVPSEILQKKIASTLNCLDSKIEINNQINQTLEEIAQAIFKSWFVDFDPVKAKMSGKQPEDIDATTLALFPQSLDCNTGLPEGWHLSEIGDEVTVVGGGTPSTKNDDFWVDGNIHWTSPKDLSGVRDKVLVDTASKITQEGLKKISSGLLPVDTVLLSSRAPVGYLALAKVPMAINQGYIAMKCNKKLPPEYVLQWCSHNMSEIKQRASGSTFAEISKKNFKPIPVVVPTDDVLCAYKKIVKPLYESITENVRQNELLSSLRDILVPKLLSGDIELVVTE
ncbi:restriction endonuclease subunit S [Vibrio alginolyticus]|nr:restriction endonuclease subunit S [Vibrio alginolyticus]RCW24488.1 type I restriction enzyme S subunit [Vibrio parahaemolyticus]